MTTEGKGPRRDFLRLTGARVAGAVVGSASVPASVKPTATPADQDDVRTFGAKVDGKTLDTDAINKAINAAAAEQAAAPSSFLSDHISAIRSI